MAFSFHKAQKDSKQFQKATRLTENGRDTISNNRNENRTSIIWFDAFNHKSCGNRNDRDDHVETMDRQDRRNRPIKFLDDGGDCDDRHDHMEARLLTHK